MPVSLLLDAINEALVGKMDEVVSGAFLPSSRPLTRAQKFDQYEEEASRLNFLLGMVGVPDGNLDQFDTHERRWNSSVPLMSAGEVEVAVR